MTIHAGLNQVALERIRKNPRQTHVVSRGGSILLEWMVANQCENPFYEHFDRLLEICREYDITLSLGDGLRPGSLKVCTMCADMCAVKHSRRVAGLLNSQKRRTQRP